MADFDTFERVLRVEVKRRKDKGQPAPSFSDVKRMIEDKEIFTSEEVKELKAQLKAKAVEICDEVYSSKKEESRSPERGPKPSKKRKADPTETGEESRAKKPKKDGAPKKKAATKEHDSDSDIAKPARSSKQKSTKSTTSKVSSQAVIDDYEDEGEKPFNKPSGVDSDAEVATSPPKSPEALDSSPNEGKKVIPAAEVAELTDADLSVLEDGSPVKPKKPKGEGKKKREPKEKSTSGKEKFAKGKSKAATVEDPNEEQIKRLKSFVVACGVRKKWAKEFEGIEGQTKKQISRLKEILEELGMTGRLSMEKAKAIRAKRELAAEIEEVVQFEARRGAKDADSGKSRSRPKKEVVHDSASEDEEELAANPPARKKIPLAFLDDQTDSE